MFKELRTSFCLFMLLLLLTGLVYPLIVLGIGQGLFPVQANGSLIEQNGAIIGSTLIGQTFTSDGYFHGRPSYAGTGYDAGNSSGSNLAPTSPDLLKAVSERVAALKADKNTFSAIPVDMVTGSGSGLDPDISVANARLQMARVAETRHLGMLDIEGLVSGATEQSTFGVLGDKRINVLKLNLALDKAAPSNAPAPHE